VVALQIVELSFETVGPGMQPQWIVWAAIRASGDAMVAKYDNSLPVPPGSETGDADHVQHSE
jgi:hypothetical protein